LMRDLAPIAKILWPKGLMPSPKAGTVTANIKQAVEEIKKWRLEFKLDKTGNIHAIIGKVSFDTDKLIENAQSFIKTLEDNKPSGVKGKLIKKIVLSPSMGPGVTVTY
jgi:large subunit ribosomal protein L1